MVCDNCGSERNLIRFDEEGPVLYLCVVCVYAVRTGDVEELAFRATLKARRARYGYGVSE